MRLHSPKCDIICSPLSKSKILLWCWVHLSLVGCVLQDDGEDKQLAVQDPCVRISTVDLCEDKQGNQSHLSRHVLPFFFHTITPTSNFYHTIPPLSSNIQFLNVIFPFLLTTWSVSRFHLESWDSNVIQLLLESFSFRNAARIQPYCWQSKHIWL